ncbi:hypothetical protein J6590_102999, partial [Homalodisca vitripennis]
ELLFRDGRSVTGTVTEPRQRRLKSSTAAVVTVATNACLSRHHARVKRENIKF